MFSARIKELRIKNGLKQQDVAKVLNVSSSMIGMDEQGRRSPSLDIVVAYAQLFSVTTDFFLWENNSNYSMKHPQTIHSSLNLLIFQ